MSLFSTYVQPVADFTARHPLLGCLIVFALALGESLPILGIVSPGTTVIMAVAALAGLGYLPLWAVLAAAVLGAIAGDGISYWYGHHYHRHALQIWPINRYPDMVSRSEQYFAEHGGKSVFMARFVPVVRAFIPLIAGVAGMKPGRFYYANVASAFVWAFAHFLPAALFGASLGLLNRISSRLVILLLVVLVLTALLTYAMRLALLWGAPALANGQRWAYERLQGRSGRMADVARRLLQPDDGAMREVAVLGGLFGLAILALLKLAEAALERGALTRSDHAISALVSGWRTSWGDNLMVYVTELGDAPVIIAVCLSAIIWLFWKKERKLSLGLFTALVVTSLFVVILKASMQIVRPNVIYHGLEAFSFPSGHTSYTAMLYGILGWIWFRGLAWPWRKVAIIGTALFVTSIAFSRIYLQAHWPSDVLAGLAFGASITAVFALAFQSTDFKKLRVEGLLLTTILAFVVVGAWHTLTSHKAGLAKYARPQSIVETTVAQWKSADWRKLPTHRVDLIGEIEEPIVLQWAGRPTDLAKALEKHGWRRATPVNLITASDYLFGSTGATALPVLPRFNNGEIPVLTLVHGAPDGVTRDVLHLWASHLVLADRGKTPILIGAVLQDRIAHPLPFLTLPSDLELPSHGFSEDFLKALKGATAVKPVSPDGIVGHQVVLAGQ